MEAVDAAFVDPIIPAINLYIIDGLQQYRDEHADGDLVIDIRLAFNINANSEVSLLCNNVLNREYSSRPAMMDAPRNFTLKYSLTL